MWYLPAIYCQYCTIASILRGIDLGPWLRLKYWWIIYSLFKQRIIKHTKSAESNLHCSFHHPLSSTWCCPSIRTMNLNTLVVSTKHFVVYHHLLTFKKKTLFFLHNVVISLQMGSQSIFMLNKFSFWWNFVWI